MARTPRNARTQQAAVDTLAFTAEAVEALVNENPALAAGLAHNAKALVQVLPEPTTNAVLALVHNAEAAKAEAAAEALDEAAEHAAIVAALKQDVTDTIVQHGEAEAAALFRRNNFAVALAHKLNAYAQAERLGVINHAPWFYMRANVLPEFIAESRELLVKVQKDSGHSNTDKTWMDVRKHAEAEAMQKSWWGLSPQVQAAREALAKAEAEAKGEGEGEGEGEAPAKAAKTPHAKAVSQIKALVKGIKKDGSGLATPEITEAAKALCVAFSLDYGTI